MSIKVKYARELQWAADNVKNHTVELVSGVSKYGTNEIWRCTNNGSSCYGFDLVISRFGIAMYGDVDTLVFSVGSQYGIEFLARDSVCSYMISKLEPEYREKRELDEQALIRVLIINGSELLNENFEEYTNEDEEDILLPEWVSKAASGDTSGVTLEMFRDEMQKHRDFQTHCLFEEFAEELTNLLDDYVPEGLQAVELFLSTHYNELNLGVEWYEHTISKHSGTLIHRLEMLRLCALKIKEVKDADSAQ